MEMALGPETRTTAMAPMPWGVATAQMVSVFKMLVCMILAIRRSLHKTSHGALI